MTDLTITVVMVVSFSAGFLVRHVLALRDVPVLDDEIRERHGSYELIRLGEAHWNRISPRRAWGIIGVLLCFLVLFAFASGLHAQTLGDRDTRWEFAAGQTDYGSHDGIWYDSFYPFNNETNVGSQILSLSVPGWRASFVHLGEAANTAQWGMHERADEIANPALITEPTFGGAGYGDVFGISLGKTIERTMRGLQLGAEGGLFLYRGEWHETYWPLDNPSAQGFDHTSHINLTTYAGATLRYGRLFAQYRVYYNIQNGLVNHSARQIAVGLSIPFGAAP